MAVAVPRLGKQTAVRVARGLLSLTLLLAAVSIISVISWVLAFVALAIGIVAIVVGFIRRRWVVILALLQVGLAAFLLWRYPSSSSGLLETCSANRLPVVGIKMGDDAPYLRETGATTQDEETRQRTQIYGLHRELDALASARERISLTRRAAIEYAAKTGVVLSALEGYSNALESQLDTAALKDPPDHEALRRGVDSFLDPLLKAGLDRGTFDQRWASDPGVQKIERMSLALTNLDNELGKLFTGIEPVVHTLTAEVLDKDLQLEETVQLTVTGGLMKVLDFREFAESAAARRLGRPEFWVSRSASDSTLERIDPRQPVDIAAGTRSVVLQIRSIAPNAITTTCKEVAYFPFEVLRVPPSEPYVARIRGEVLVEGRDKNVPFVSEVKAPQVLERITLPAYAFFTASRPFDASAVLNQGGTLKQVLTPADTLTPGALQSRTLWIELLPARVRMSEVYEHRERLFPVNAGVALAMAGLTSLLALVFPTKKS